MNDLVVLEQRVFPLLIVATSALRRLNRQQHPILATRLRTHGERLLNISRAAFVRDLNASERQEMRTISDVLREDVALARQLARTEEKT